MAQDLQITTERGATTLPTLKHSLTSLARKMGDPRVFRDPENLRSQIMAMGDREAIEAELRKLIDGPPKATAKDFAVCLGRLALHYWRPDFTAEQAKLLYQDFISDLAGVTAEELNEACGEWRRGPRSW